MSLKSYREPVTPDTTDNRTIDNRADFDFIRYANCWEDAELLVGALDLDPGDRVLSVGSAGDNALAMLAEGAEVVAVDVSPAQVACLDLRRAAFRHLSYRAVLRFLGLRDSLRRAQVYRRLRDDLTRRSRAFWDDHPRDIQRGIIHAGKFENYFRIFRQWALPLVHRRSTVEALMAEKPAAERRRFYRERWDTLGWQLLFRVFFSRWMLGMLGRDAEFFRYVDGPVSREILRRTRYALTELPVHDNPYVEYILTGNFERALPPYLERERFEAIRDNLDGLTIVEGKLGEVAAEDGGIFDAYNLSDVFEYLDEAATGELLDTLADAAAPGARLAYWNMLVPRRGHELRPERLRPMTDLARSLFKRDRAFFYGDFLVEEVVG
jgi:S-adenosylmethionine-diacylglycerol 3-amino-3-carboxypropyl transferase